MLARCLLPCQPIRPHTSACLTFLRDADPTLRHHCLALDIQRAQRWSRAREDTYKAAWLTPDTDKAALLIPDTDKAALLIPDTDKAALLTPDTDMAALLTPDTCKEALLTPVIIYHCSKSTSRRNKPKTNIIIHLMSNIQWLIS